MFCKLLHIYKAGNVLDDFLELPRRYSRNKFESGWFLCGKVSLQGWSLLIPSLPPLLHRCHFTHQRWHLISPPLGSGVTLSIQHEVEWLCSNWPGLSKDQQLPLPLGDVEHHVGSQTSLRRPCCEEAQAGLTKQPRGGKPENPAGSQKRSPKHRAQLSCPIQLLAMWAFPVKTRHHASHTNCQRYIPTCPIQILDPHKCDQIKHLLF